MTATAQRRRVRKTPPRVHPAGSLLRRYRTDVQIAYGMQRRDRYGETEIPSEAFDLMGRAKDHVVDALVRRWGFAYMRNAGRVLDVLARHRREIAGA